MEYNFTDIEEKWQAYWQENSIYKVTEDPGKPKYYVLDMFPYPSGAGLHVGHPLGYVASDIFARYKRMKGFNVLHPMGYDSFGLPAEQYAIQTGQHPAKTTEENIKTYRKQLDKIGFSFDWSREVRTSDPNYYKWTQWIFLQLFESWYNPESDRAEQIDTLVEKFKKNGTEKGAWTSLSEKEQQKILMNYRLAYTAESEVWWCPALGTVLANDEVKDGVSERGGHPVYKKPMQQWFLRITAYAERLLQSLENLDWAESMKEMQRNWIGRSEGASIEFKIQNPPAGRAGSKFKIDVFTTRPDTIFGCTYMVLAPEHKLTEKITTAEQKDEIEKYIQYVKQRSERDRMSEVKKITGAFTGAYAIHPFTGEKLPIWTAEYVLAGYGTGAIMAVPAHDERDHAFAKHFNLPIKQVVAPSQSPPAKEMPPIAIGAEGAFPGREGKLINSDFLNGLEVKESIQKAIEKIEKRGIGEKQINYRLRDSAFSRQRYWGEPFPIYYKPARPGGGDGMPHALPEEELPLELPEIDEYKPTETGEPPLARAKDWKYKGEELETDTMPGYAGSSWYFFRYMDPENDQTFVSKEKQQYWQNVDLYMGGAEHATGHLLYARLWTKFLYDLGYVTVEEPFQKMINQGMIQGMSYFMLAGLWMGKDDSELQDNFIISKTQTEKKSDDLNLVLGGIPFEYIDAYPNFRVPIEYVKENNRLYEEDFQKLEKKSYQVNLKVLDWETDNEGKNYLTLASEPEKMSKSKYNVVNPDEVIAEYGADTFRMYEMFLGPIEQHKPWDTKGIDGVHRFLKKFWRLFFDDNGKTSISDEKPNRDELKILHKTLKKVTEDIERFSFNTAISAFMVCTNELTSIKCKKRAILELLTVALAPFAPHIAEELWQDILENKGSVVMQDFPEYKEEFTKESTKEYPVMINGKKRADIELPLDLPKEEVEERVLKLENVQKWLEGKAPKKVIFVPGKIVNIVV